MEITGSHVDIDTELFNQLFLLAELDAQHQFISMNALLQQMIGLDSNQVNRTTIEQYFSPLITWESPHADWSVIWESVESSNQWQGYIQSITNGSSKLFVTIKTRESGYYIIAQDRTQQISNIVAELHKVQQLTNLIEAFDEAAIIAITDTNGVLTYVNDKFCEVSQYQCSELIGSDHSIISSEHSEDQYNELWMTISEGKVWRKEWKSRAKDGSKFWLKTTVVPVVNEVNATAQIVWVHHDITDRVTAEMEHAATIDLDFKRMIKNLQNCVFKAARNTQGDIIFKLCEGKLAEQLGITTEQVGGKLFRDVCGASSFAAIAHHYEQAFLGEYQQFEVQYHGRYFLVSLSPVLENKEIDEIVASMIEVTQRKKAEELIRYMAHYDPLTGLPNRTSFIANLQQALMRSQQQQHTIAIMYINLDRFKTINDTMGHDKGDELLQQVAQRLQRIELDRCYIARNGGDVFSIYIEQADRVRAAELAQFIIQQLRAPYVIEELEVYVSPSVGISMYPNDGDGIEQLTTCADAAMSQAKNDNKSKFRFYNEELHQQASQRLKLERDLRKAVEQGEFELWYQPKIRLSDNELIGMEALLRWNHPTQGLVLPGDFIQIAEDSNLIIPIGEWVLREACRQMKQWLEAGMTNLSVAVNISFQQFADVEFPECVDRVLREADLAPQYLELEITESVAHNVKHAIHALTKIKALGVRVSIDDFGTGYSSLSSLSQFPIDRLKIDQSFVRNLNENNQAIIRSILDIANHMNITVIAEGVETKEQVIFLQEHRCQEAQGYYYSKPMPKLQASNYLFDRRN